MGGQLPPLSRGLDLGQPGFTAMPLNCQWLPSPSVGHCTQSHVHIQASPVGVLRPRASRWGGEV